MQLLIRSPWGRKCSLAMEVFLFYKMKKILIMYMTRALWNLCSGPQFKIAPRKVYSVLQSPALLEKSWFDWSMVERLLDTGKSIYQEEEIQGSLMREGCYRKTNQMKPVARKQGKLYMGQFWKTNSPAYLFRDLSRPARSLWQSMTRAMKSSPAGTEKFSSYSYPEPKREKNQRTTLVHI